MKKILLFTSLFLLVINSFSQEDTLFPNVHARWIVKTSHMDGTGIYYGGYDVQFYKGSIPMLGHEWSMLGSGFVRMDSGRIYYRDFGVGLQYGQYHNWSDTSEVLMYDFNLNVGDTAYWTKRDGVGPEDPVIVDSIGMTNVLGSPRKTFYLDNQSEWIYGLGSTKGFYQPIMTEFELSSSLSCFRGEYEDSLGQNYILDYSNNNGECFLEVNEKIIQESIINVNYFSDRIEINSDDKNLLKIYSLDGKVVHKETIVDGSNVIYLNEFKKGLYIVRIGNEYAEKFVIH